MFEDYTFSLPLPDVIRKLDTLAWVSLGGLVLGLAISGLGMFHLLFFSQVTSSTEPGEVLGTQSVLGNIYVDVSGAVEKPGLYQFQTGDRVAQALEKAGGLSVEADARYLTEQLNLARKLNDGDKLVIPLAGVNQAPVSVPGVSQAQNSSGLININTASQKELETLPQIGEKRATDIVQNRPYAIPTELRDKGIVTEKIFNEIQALIST